MRGPQLVFSNRLGVTSMTAGPHAGRRRGPGRHEDHCDGELGLAFHRKKSGGRPEVRREGRVSGRRLSSGFRL